MRTIALATVITLLALPAWAYSPTAGDRAADIYGRDVISDSVVHLDDYAGQWVFIDFWASWCGPCIGELPNMLAETRPYRDRGDLALFSVSLDSWSSVDRMHTAIREHGIDYPVTFDGGGWETVQSREWGIRSIPATFLVNPDGVIVASNLRGAALGPALDFYLNYESEFNPAGLRSSNVLNEDGSVDVMLELYSPTHAPLQLEVDWYYTRYTWAEDDPEHEQRPIDREYIDEMGEEPDLTATVEFEMFGDAVYTFTIPAYENTHYLAYYVHVTQPGTEHLMDGEGIKISARGRMSLEQE